MSELKYLEPLMKRGSDFLQCKYPILCGAMTWVSEPNLVAAVSNSGCFGCLAGGNAPTDILPPCQEMVPRLFDQGIEAVRPQGLIGQ